jgi:hypothetical protein
LARKRIQRGRRLEREQDGAVPNTPAATCATIVGPPSVVGMTWKRSAMTVMPMNRT